MLWWLFRAGFAGAVSLICLLPASAQTSPAAKAPAAEEPVTLSVFEVSAANDKGYAASTAMTGTRTNNLLALRFTRDTNTTDATLIIEAASSATNDTPWTGIATNRIFNQAGTAPSCDS